MENNYDDLFENVFETPNNTSQESLNIISLDTLMTEEFPEQQWIVDKLIPTEGITIISGSPASFKTWVVLEIAIRIAEGRPVFGYFNTSQSPILILDEESGKQELQKRIKNMTGNKNLPIYISSRNGTLLTEEMTLRLITFMIDHNIKLVIFDSLIRFHSADENDASEMSKFFRYVTQITSAGISVLFTHHHRKNSSAGERSSNSMRGSGDILAAIDCHLIVKREDKSKVIEISQAKLRQDQEIEDIAVLLDDTGESGIQLIYSPNHMESTNKTSQDIENEIYAFFESSTEQEVTRKTIFESIKKAGITTKYNDFKLILEQLILADIIEEKQGAGRTKYLYLKDILSQID